MIPDISEIGQFDYSWDFDQDDYNEYLQDNELENNKQTLLDYIYDNVSFEIDFLDNETFHRFETEYMYLDEISENFGDKLAQTVLDDCLKNGNGSIEKVSLFDDEIDLNNSQEVNAFAKKVLQSGDYMKDCRGFILTDGTVVYTPTEHNQCTAINGVKGTFHFISLGNIRVLQNSIDIEKEPTPQQRQVLRQVISSYANDVLYVDIMGNNGTVSAEYIKPNWRYVLGEIDRYFSDGIKPSGSKNLYENVLNYRDLTPEPLRQRWHHERKSLKEYLINYGQNMISRENGKEYKVIQDTFVSNLLGMNFCICLQWDSLTNTPGEIIYVRASDKFIHTN